MKVVMRQEAKRLGIKRYFTGKPCKNGHCAERRVDDKGCIECVKNKCAIWYIVNKTKVISRSSQWHKNNKDRSKYLIARWARENPLRRSVSSAKSLAKRRCALGSHTTGDLRAILKAQRDRCAMCRRKMAGKYNRHLDHIIAIINGGTNWPKNLQYLCRRCNLSKNAKDPADHAREMGLLL